MTATAIDFSLKERPPGPGHPRRSYLWKFNHATWELTPPEHYALLGGEELRLQEDNNPGLAAICRESTATERDLLVKGESAPQDAYFRTLLPSPITDLKLVSQGKNPLPVNGLINFGIIYDYKLGGVAYRAAYMVSRGGESGDTAQAKDQNSVGPTAEFFTTVIYAPVPMHGDLQGDFYRLMATAKITAGDPGEIDPSRISSHGMLGR